MAQDAVGKNVFTAIYGTTTFDEVQEAYDEGKTIILKEETPWEPGSETNSVYYLTYLADDSHALFIGSYYVESAYKSNPESACPYSEIYLVQLTASNEWSTITHRINPMHGATSSYDGHEGLVPAPTINDRNKFLKGDGTWGTLVPNKIALVATAGQTSFTIPFEYDSLSSNLTVYFNGILMKETDNYTVNTSNNTVNLVGFSAESGDIITIMGLLGAQSIDFSQEAIDAINRINAAVEKAEEDIDKKIQTAFE